MVIGEGLKGIAEELKNSGNENPIFEAHLIFRHYLNMSPMDLVLNENKELSEKELNKIESALKRRIEHEPLQYILNSQEFMGLDFYVDKNVLIPRQDTETLVEYVINHFKNKSYTAFEIGIGSGCISVSLAHFNKNAFIRGIDISANAVEISEKNAKKNNVSDRVCFENADVFKYMCFGKYDLVVSNPPYIRTKVIESLDKDVKEYEPHLALDGGDDGLEYYRYITSLSQGLLNKGGMLAFEVGYDQAEDVCELLNDKFQNIEIVKDLCGVNRVVSGLLK